MFSTQIGFQNNKMFSGEPQLENLLIVVKVFTVFPGILHYFVTNNNINVNDYKVSKLQS